MSFHLPALPFDDAGAVFALLFALTLLVPVVAQRARIPVVVGFVLAGMLVGPGVTGLLERRGGVALLGTAGLLYLMFIAGLELDLNEFIVHRRASLVFGLSGFAIPMALGFVAMTAMGFGMLAAVLLASCWASHTLIAYPEYQRYGTARNRAVSVTVGATILTDTLALLVLAVVAGAHRGALGPAFWLTLVPSIAALLAAALWLLPALGRRFFSGLGQDTSTRFLFVVAVVFAFAWLSEVAGIESIVGAFLAGLAMNRLVPNDSALMGRLEFFGNQFFIPVFLLSVGLLIDPSVMFDPAALGLAAGFTVVALVAKILAAEVTGRAFRYDRVEIGSMTALSSAQAAATLAAVLVGVEIDLIGARTLNAVVVVIAVTCVFSSWLGNRTARQLPHPPPRTEIGSTVVVPVARPDSAGPLVGIAAALARPASGLVVPVVVSTPYVPEDTLDSTLRSMREAERLVRSYGVESEGVFRVDSSPAAGIHHTVVERRASLMVVGWKGSTTRREALFGGILDQIVAQGGVPTIIARTGTASPERIVLAVPQSATVPAARGSVVLAVEAVRRLTLDDPRPIVVLTEVDDDELVATTRGVLGAELVHEPLGLDRMLLDHVRRHDLVVLPAEPGLGRVPTEAARIADRLGDTPLLIAIDGHMRGVGDLQHARLSTEHPFGPPPWRAAAPR